MVILKYEIEATRGIKKGKFFGASMDPDRGSYFKTQESIENWFNNQVNKRTFGKPERDFIYKRGLYSIDEEGNRALIKEDNYTLDPEYVGDIISSTDSEDVDGDRVIKTYTYRLKPEYSVTITDIESAVTIRDQKRSAKQAKKGNAENKLKRLADLDLSKKADIRKAIRWLIEYLELDIDEV